MNQLDDIRARARVHAANAGGAAVTLREMRTQQHVATLKEAADGVQEVWLHRGDLRELGTDAILLYRGTDLIFASVMFEHAQNLVQAAITYNDNARMRAERAAQNGR